MPPPERRSGPPLDKAARDVTAPATALDVSTVQGSTGYGLAIFSQHAQLLAGSAISPEVARERGYVSADTRKQLERYGFERYQQRVPGLLIPLHRADGSVWGYQLRADTPRVTKAGTTVKYETPKGQRNGIDIPPAIRETIGDPSVPLLVTEGTRKADSAVSAGLACVALPGVWGWRGTNGHGGKLAVADWHDIALNGRRVVLAFDSDVTVKPAVRRALDELAAYLATKGATVEYLHLPDSGDGKTGLDDYLAAPVEGSGGLWALVRPDPPAPQEAADPPPIPARLLHTFTPRRHGRLTRTFLPGWCVMRGHGVASQVSTATRNLPTWPSPAGYWMTRCRSRSRACRVPGSPTRSARCSGSSRTRPSSP
jgi:Domain of unknown function (DUF3854)